MGGVLQLPDGNGEEKTYETCPNGRCACGCTEGIIETKGQQDVVRCRLCNKYLFCAPKTLTGREVRTLKTTHEAITTKQRGRIIERANGRCETCGSRNALQVGHVVSVFDGHAAGLSDAIINSDENLICQCAECNSGMGKGTVPLRMYVAILNARNVGK